MATTQEPRCTTCQKAQSTLAIPLMRCAKCKSTRYCSRTCQAADWKARHKQTCNTNKEAHEAGLKALEQTLGCKAIPQRNDGLDAARATLEKEFGADFFKISKLS